MSYRYVYNSYTYWDSVEDFFKNNERLEKLNILFILQLYSIDFTQIDTTLTIVSNLKHLIELKINTNKPLSHELVANGLTQIAINSQIT